MRAARIVACAVAFAAGAASAFHVEFGFSGKSMYLDYLIRNGRLISPVTDIPWRSWTCEIGETNSVLSIASGNPRVQLLERFETTNGTVPIGVNLIWKNRHDTTRLSAESTLTSVGDVNFLIAETVNLATIGYAASGGIYLISNGVFTCRGDPYSTVVNDTSEDRTINGVQIRAGESAALKFPVYIRTDEIDGVRFYDLDSDTEIVPHDYGNGEIYRDGAYTLGWTGGIRIVGGAAVTNAPNEKLVYGDLNPANSNKLLYARNGMPIRSAIVDIATNVSLMTWWDFDESLWGSPKAKINGEVVCEGHSTSHIINYVVSTNITVNKITGKGNVSFTMSLEPSGGVGGGCVMRCWDETVGSSTSAYYNAPTNHRAEVSAGLREARFVFEVDIYAHDWSVRPEDEQ